MRALGEVLILYARVRVCAVRGVGAEATEEKSVMAFRCDWWEKGRAIAKGPASRSIGQA